MVFDQYQRYETISRMISIIKRQEETEKFKILEVGANAQKTLSNFISDEIFFTDIQEIEELKDDDHFFVADATNLDGIENDEYDIVVANILADVIIPMAPVIPARLKKGGYFITSCIIDFKEDQVKEAIEKAGLTVVEINHQGEWVNITAQKR